MNKFKLFLFLYIILIFSFIAMLILSIHAIVLHNKLQKSLVNEHQGIMISEELRHSSDDLTRFARTYAATGDPKYEKFYWQVLDIRNGIKPRPKNYDKIYWDLCITAEEQSNSYTEMESLKKEWEKLN